MLLTFLLVLSTCFCFKPEEELLHLETCLVLELRLLMYRTESWAYGEFFSWLLLRICTLPGSRYWENQAETSQAMEIISIHSCWNRHGLFPTHRTRLICLCFLHVLIKQAKKIADFFFSLPHKMFILIQKCPKLMILFWDYAFFST